MGEINPKIAFIGCGAMGEAILKGMLLGNVASVKRRHKLVACCRGGKRLSCAQAQLFFFNTQQPGVHF